MVTLDGNIVVAPAAIVESGRGRELGFGCMFVQIPTAARSERPIRSRTSWCPYRR
jgi:hypothetical protein